MATNIRRNRSILAANYSDPSKPNYRPSHWRRSVEHWQETLDWCGFLDDFAFKNDYLCHIPGEFTEDRASRIEAEDPEPYFKDACKDHASIFSQFEIAETAPETLIENQDNVDLQGSDLWQWMGEPLKALFRDGGAVLGVDIAQDVPATAAELRRPRLVWVPLRDLFWVEYRDVGGVAVWSRCAIRKTVNRVDGNGELQLLNQYWAYELIDDACFVTRWEENFEKQLIQGEPMLLTDAANRPLSRLPFTDHFCFVGDFNLDEERFIMSAFADVLSLNKKHYNQSSELSHIRRKTACPTPARFWGGGVPDPVPPFYAGSGKCQDYDADSRVEYLELKGESMPELRVGLQDTEDKLQQRTNKFFRGASNMTATEAAIQNQKAKVGLPLVKAMIESALQDVFRLWEMLATPSPAEDVASIIIDAAALEAPPNAADIGPYLQAVDRGVPIQVVTEALIRRGHFTKQDFEEAGVVPGAEQLPIDPDEVIA